MPEESNEQNIPPWRQRGIRKLLNQHPEKHEIVVVGNDNPLHNERIVMTPMAGVILNNASEKAPALMKLSFDLR